MKFQIVLRSIIAMTACSALMSCASLTDVLRAKQEGGQGTIDVYKATSDQSWEIAKTVFRWEGADAIEEHRDQNYMLTSSGTDFLSWGTVMGAWVEPINVDNTKVTVITKRRMQIGAFTTLTEYTFQQRFKQALKILQSGNKLPLTPPD